MSTPSRAPLFECQGFTFLSEGNRNNGVQTVRTTDLIGVAIGDESSWACGSPAGRRATICRCCVCLSTRTTAGALLVDARKPNCSIHFLFVLCEFLSKLFWTERFCVHSQSVASFSCAQTYKKTFEVNLNLNSSLSRVCWLTNG